MNKIIKISFFASIMLIYSCKVGNKPKLTTTPVTKITSTSAISGGTVSDQGSDPIIKQGVMWDVNSSPSITNSTQDSLGVTTYTSKISGLKPNTKYYVRAYAENDFGMGLGDVLSFTTTKAIGHGTVTDVDGNTYKTVIIDDVEWMAENLKTTKYNDNSSIPNVTTDTWTTLTTPAYCWYANNISNKETYGALYNWHAVGTKKLCPSGWHVSSNADWTALATYLKEDEVITNNTMGGKLKEIETAHWKSPNTNATNEVEFSALPGGYRGYNLGYFSGITTSAYFWTSTEQETTSAYRKTMSYDNDQLSSVFIDKKEGYSVRCVKD